MQFWPMTRGEQSAGRFQTCLLAVRGMKTGRLLSLWTLPCPSLPPNRAALGALRVLACRVGGLQCEVGWPPGATFEQRLGFGKGVHHAGT